ncbi:type IIA DNA topoisomerase subunit B [bacterium]|jgi:topoisomerase-4 subunit B|nr:type IIA DNA topoisomerase subunit B [Verrucomicrobiales bacterium]MDB2348069.1 type IIA DNA topoisomerase subunit B [Verrucomicrobiales bacterium]MDB4507731.1 type IIA DNA topoisomerase subunit B [bacterium]MDF1788847.1 DNA topoisomerase IV subunit B [Verrucomicrobiales bacterium]
MAKYNEDSIRTLDWQEHIRLRPGMYIGKLGDGSTPDDGIYVLAKEVIDNSIDEFVMGNGKLIEVTLDDGAMWVRDYGRGIPLGKLEDCAAKINTGAKYDSEAFKKSVGLNGVGIKAVNALSSQFNIQAFREGKTRDLEFSRGILKKDCKRSYKTVEQDGTELGFRPDEKIFKNYQFQTEYLEKMFRFYSYLNTGLTIKFNGKSFRSKNGLLDLLNETLSDEPRYPVAHLSGHDIEIAFTHGPQYGEEYYSFVNGQHTTQGGTHLAAFREAFAKTVRDFYKKKYEAADIRGSIIAAISIKVQEPVFESQTKTKLGSTHIAPGGATIRTFIGNFVAKELDNYLHKHPEVAKALENRIQQAELERKELKGIQKMARERARKAKINNSKLRDCRVHFNTKHKLAEQTTVFITEGNSASGTIGKARSVDTQAVFSLKGKPLNCFGLSKKVVYENEEFNLLQHALNIEDGLEGLRYNRVVLATDADVDGMHIRLLLVTFFLQFFSDLIKQGHVYILQTPLFRVRNKKITRYCYSEEDRVAAMKECGKTAEITRFKGLGEIDGKEMSDFIGSNIRLDPVIVEAGSSINEMLTFYMGKNTADRQKYIIDNLRVEESLDAEEEDEEAMEEAV